tara:strand:- start:826 stop:3381 length:2556 start_codon:yes stop_codon:yes gene_type:complete
MTTQVTYQGIEYTVADGETVDDLLKKKGFAEAHEQNMLEMTSELVAPTPREQQLMSREEEKSSVGTALLQGLSNDQGYQTAWLAQQRFPELVERGIDPVDYYFLDEDEDIAYIDPYSNEVVKEFKDNLLVDTARYAGPTAQFLGELGVGTAGLVGGAFLTGNPFGAAAGGAGGTALGGGAVYAGRAGISAAFDGPPLKTSKLADDLMVSSAFGAIPFGTKAAQLAGSAFRTASTRFPGKDGKTALETILRDGGETIDEKVAFAKERFGVDLTRAEAQGIMSNAGAIQRYLQMQPGSQKLWDFYHNRQLQVEEAADVFFNEILRGDYLAGLKRSRLSGRQGLDPDVDLTKASDEVLKKLSAKRQERASPVYKNSFDLELEAPIDVSDIARQLQMDLADPNLRGKARSVKQDLLDALTDFSGLSKTTQGELALKDNTEMLHNALTNDFRPLIEGLTKDAQLTLRREVSRIREKVSNKLKAANPEYARATAIYDPSKGHLQVLDRSVINNLAQAAELGGEQAARLTQKLFSGNIKPKDIRLLRRLIQTEDPQVWQNIKGTWLRTQFDDAITSSVNPLGVNNKFLSRLGIRGRVMMGRGAEKVRGTKAKVFSEILDPQELDNFVGLVEMMQATSFIASRGGSPTQPLLALQKLLDKETRGLGRMAAGAVRAAMEIPQRILIRGFDDATAATIAFQREVYEDKLIDALIDPTVAADLAKAINAVNPAVYFVSQAATRGGAEVFDSILEDRLVPDKINPTTGQLERGPQGIEMIESAKEVTQPEQPLEDPQAMLQGLSVPQVGGDVSAFEPLPQGPSETLAMGQIDPAMSPTILPSDKDRELAMRLRGPLGGIASLA